MKNYFNAIFLKDANGTQKVDGDKYLPTLPFINFPNNWKIQILPSYGGHLLRFRIETEGLYLEAVLNAEAVNPHTGDYDARWRIEAEEHPQKRNVRFYAKDYPNIIPVINEFIDSLKP